MINDYHIIERRKAQCREKIRFHTENVILQSIVSLMCLVGGTYAGTKQSIVVPLLAYPMASASVLKLTQHETERRRYTKILKKLERE